ncbi:hypothetical protein Tco_0267423 [Tanacetum coccineum]
MRDPPVNIILHHLQCQHKMSKSGKSTSQSDIIFSHSNISDDAIYSTHSTKVLYFQMIESRAEKFRSYERDGRLLCDSSLHSTRVMVIDEDVGYVVERRRCEDNAECNVCGKGVTSVFPHEIEKYTGWRVGWYFGVKCVSGWVMMKGMGELEGVISGVCEGVENNEELRMSNDAVTKKACARKWLNGINTPIPPRREAGVGARKPISTKDYQINFEVKFHIQTEAIKDESYTMTVHSGKPPPIKGMEITDFP